MRILAGALVLSVLLAAPAAAHTDPTTVSPKNGSVVAVPVTSLAVAYPEPVGVYSVTVTNGTTRKVIKVGKRASRFAIPMQTGKGAWVAAWDTKMPDGDEVVQATTWRVGRLPGAPKPLVKEARKSGAVLTVSVTDARPGAPAVVKIATKGAQLVESYVTTAGVDVPLDKRGGSVVLVRDSTVSSMVLLPDGTVATLSVSL